MQRRPLFPHLGKNLEKMPFYMPCSMALRSKVSWKNMHMSMTAMSITIIMMTNVAADMTMIMTTNIITTTIMTNMSIIMNMMRTAPADATIMTMNTIMITTMKSMSIIMNMMGTAPADAMTITTDTKDIIMQMKYLQAGARRLPTSIQKKNWITC